MQHVSDTKRADRHASATAEALLRAAAQWQPERPIADGVLASAMTRKTRARRVDGLSWAWAAACAPVAAALLLAFVVRRHDPASGVWRVASGSRHVSVGRAAAPSASGHLNGVVRPKPAAAGATRPDSPPRCDTRASGVSPRLSPTHRRVTNGRGASNVVTPGPQQTRLVIPDRGVAWRTYTVPRYVAGISTGALIRAGDSDGNAEFVRAVLDVPLGEMYGEPSDDHHVELDVIPVRHVMEDFDE